MSWGLNSAGFSELTWEFRKVNRTPIRVERSPSLDSEAHLNAPVRTRTWDLVPPGAS